ncbi:MAG: hypothetical protein A4E49_02969 [Methanosaeta sp. PtaU1.Bin112]|nr:MAG: hypothetical protein A4E49_02969 [Methanosaeta sp. PtaU1.Bin112]
MKATPEIDRKAYELAREFLLNIPGVTEIIIEKYQNLPSFRPKPSTKNELYRDLLESAQNANMKTKVVGEAIGGVDKLALISNDFDPEYILKSYASKWDVLDQIVQKLNPRGKIRRTQRSIWPRYCQTILSAAEFIDRFDSADEFFEWVDCFDRDDRSRACLPMLLDHEIEGFGFALSCNFLKELGYVNFPKPDVHLRDIFTALALCDDGIDDYKLFKAIIRVARNAKVTPYALDKIFWLIGSGNFYDDPSIGLIGRRQEDFVEFARINMARL